MNIRNLLSVGLFLLLSLSAARGIHAAALKGEIARSDFRAWSTNFNGVWLHFNQLVSGTSIGNQWSNRYGVVFATVTDPSGKRLAKPTPVVTSSSYAYNLGRITIVGSPCAGCLDDKACDYEIRFVRPQRWAGIQRYWRGPTVTRFIAADGDVLLEAEGEGFHGWMADSEERDFWISRIQITTSPQADAREVGYSDDLIYGTNFVSRLLPFLSLRTMGPPLANPIQKRSFQADYRAGILGETNDFLSLTNELAPGGPSGTSRSKIDLLLDVDPPPTDKPH